MSFWFDRGEEAFGAVLPERLAPARATGFVENFSAALDETMIARRSVSRVQVMSEAYDPIIAALNEGVGFRDQFPNPFLSTPSDPLIGPRNRKYASSEMLQKTIWQEIARRRAAGIAENLDGLPGSREDFDAQIAGEVKAVVDEQRRVASSATAAGVVGELVGGMVGAMTDPPNFLTLPLGAPASWGILRTAVAEGAINAAIEGLAQPEIAAWRNQVGVGYTAEEALRNIAFAAGGGAILGGGLKGLQRLFGGVETAIDAPPRAILKATENSTDARVREAHRAATREVEIDEELPATNPAADVTGEHRARLETAEAAIEREPGAGAAMPDRAAFEAAPAERLATGDDLDGMVFRFAPAELLVDAKRFQFKTGGTAAGVTDRLAGITTWDPIKAGQIVVWEDLAGKRFITDGHQRLALARRLEGEGQRVRMYGYLLREADGFDEVAAREIAAVKNIAEGTGTAVDVAKVLRASPARLAELPLSSALVRAARDLVKLSDEAYMMAVNDIVPERVAAAVGRIAEGRPELHAQIIALLARAAPDNQVQADAIIEQALQVGVSRETTINLFGEEDVAVLLFVERARVLDGGLKKLKRARVVFATLRDEASRIEGAGNRLAGDANELRAREDGEAIEIIKRLANRKGPLGDALNDAAAVGREQGIPAGVGQFTQAVRDLARDGGLARLVAGAGGRGGEAAPQGRPGPPGDARGLADAPALEFDNPVTGAGQADQAARLEADLRRDLPQDGESGIRAPVGERVGEDGIVTAETRTAEEILEDLDADDEFVEALDLICGPGK